MSFISIIITFFSILAIVGIGWMIIGLIVFLYGRIETAMLRRKIPDKIKKEVEDARIKREGLKQDFARKYAGTGNPEMERAIDSTAAGTASERPEELQYVSDRHESDATNGNSEAEGRNESVDRPSKRRRLRRIE